jgi:predicted DCC family thiol-disulfide oxidoreductase YuxK
MYESDTLPHPVILFDGVCNLCNKTVQFVIKHDKDRLYRFASFQSNFGREVLQYFNIKESKFETFILLENGKMYDRSSGALRVTKKLKGGWKMLYGFMFVPKFMRDAVYNVVARNRYKWFGKEESCWVPTPELKELFYN